MALIKCPECGKEISDKSEKCIHCGFPLRNEPIIQECINGKYYDVTFLKDMNLSYVQKLKKLNDLTGCGLAMSKEITKKYHVEQEKVEKSRVEDNTLRCPTCNSTNVKKISATSKVIGASMFGLFSKTARSQFKCEQCGYKW